MFTSAFHSTVRQLYPNPIHPVNDGQLRPKFPGTVSIVNVLSYLKPRRTYGRLTCLKQWVSEKKERWQCWLYQEILVGAVHGWACRAPKSFIPLSPVHTSIHCLADFVCCQTKSVISMLSICKSFKSPAIPIMYYHWHSKVWWRATPS